MSNAPGLLISYWLNGGAAKLQYSDQRANTNTQENPPRNDQCNYFSGISYQEKMVSLILLFWLLGLSTIFLILDQIYDADEQKNAVGFMAVINLIFFWGSPLSTIVTVCTERDSSSIHVPTMVTNTACSFFWCLYGLAISDYFIFFPNLVGVVLGFIQAILRLMFSRSEADLDELSTSELCHEEEISHESRLL